MRNSLLNSPAGGKLLAACMFTVCAAMPSWALADVETYQNTLRSTTWVLAKTSDKTSSGAGVLVDEKQKLVVTNFHVVGDSRNTVVFFPDLQEGRAVVDRQHYLDNVRKLGIRGRVIAVDRKRDLALIQLDKLPEGAKAIELAAATASPGQAVQSVGNPGSTDALWVYTSGTVRAAYKKMFRTGAGDHEFMVLETQSPINTGDSGGPVVDGEGKLVGIAQAIAPNARLVSYCVDITEVKAFLSSPWKPAPLPISEVLIRSEMQFTAHATGHFEIQYELADKQKQQVFVTKDIEYYEKADVRKIWSLAGSTKEQPSAEMALKLLQQSARTKLGAWTVEKTEQGDYLVIFCVKLDATATADTVKSTVEYVAKLAAVMKKELAPKATAQNASGTLDDWLKN